jgi:V8-like Glu-specific endopeptidase
MSTSILIRRLTGTGKGKEETLTTQEVSFGTGPHNTVRFDPTWDRGVAASHSRIWRDESGVWHLQDAGSSTGTFVNGQRITMKREVSGPTVIELGQNGPKVEVVLPPAMPGASPRPPQRVGASSGGGKWLAFAAVIALSAAALWWFKSGSNGGNADERLQRVAAEYADAVGVVAVATNRGPMPFGTAWAVGEDTFVTNAHVIEEVLNLNKKGASLFVIINRHPELNFRIKAVHVHPKALNADINVQGRKPAVPPYDIGLLTVDGKAPKAFKVASDEKLHDLTSGTRVAFLGFPMENLSGGGVNNFEPVANMQSGNITSVTDYWLAPGRDDTRLLVSHNLPATGGASGSPIFDADGEIVAVLSAGNIQLTLSMSNDIKLDQEHGGKVVPLADAEALKVTRAPSAALINFGQRADIVREVLALREKGGE